MKRILSHSLFLILFVVNAVAGTAHTVEIKPLVQSPLISISDFKEAEVIQKGDRAILSLKLKSGAIEKLKSYTEKNVGHELPLVIDGKVVGTPVIRVPIQDGVFQVEPLDQKTANQIAQYVNEQNK